MVITFYNEILFIYIETYGCALYIYVPTHICTFIGKYPFLTMHGIGLCFIINKFQCWWQTWSSRFFNSWDAVERLSYVFCTSDLSMSFPLTAVASSACICSTWSSLEYNFSFNKLVTKRSALSSIVKISYTRNNMMHTSREFQQKR